MKKMILWILVLALCLAGCANNAPAAPDAPDATQAAAPAETPAQAESTPAPEADLFDDAPQDYGYALRVTINPDFLLFVRAGNHEVTGFRALNEDARSMEDRLPLLNRPLRDALKDVVNVAIDDGFLKEGGEVKLEVLRTSEDENGVQDLLQETEETVRQTGEERGMAITPVPVTAPDIEYHEPKPGDEPGQNPGDEPGQEPGDQPGQEPGDQPGQEPGDQPGQEPGDQPGQEPGDDPETHAPRQEQEGCSVCQGSGKCDLCEGTGITDCIRCHATGKENGETCPDCDGTAKAPCPACQGSGVCAACGGSGLKPD